MYVVNPAGTQEDNTQQRAAWSPSLKETLVNHIQNASHGFFKYISRLVWYCYLRQMHTHTLSLDLPCVSHNLYDTWSSQTFSSTVSLKLRTSNYTNQVHNITILMRYITAIMMFSLAYVQQYSWKPHKYLSISSCGILYCAVNIFHW